ncbi:ribonuclease H-like domain-containing protein [Tanacetum coccineum]
MQTRSSNPSLWSSSATAMGSNVQGINNHELLVRLLGQLGFTPPTNVTQSIGSSTVTLPSANMVNSVVYHTHASPLPNFVAGLVGYSSPSLVYHTTQVQPVHYGFAPLGFTYPTAQPNFYMVSLAQSTTQVGPLPDFSPTYLTTSPGQPLTQFGSTGPMFIPRQKTTLPHAFSVMSLQDPTISACNMDTCAGYHFNDSVTSLSDNFNMYMYPSILVGDRHSIPVTNTGPFCFSVKDFKNHRVLLRCDSMGDLYPVTTPSPIPHAFLTSQHMWHQRLRHPGSEVLRRLISHNFISCNKEKPPILCRACQLGKHVRLPFASFSTPVTSCFDIVHSDVWTSPIPSLPGINVDETFSPVVKPGIIQTVLSLATSQHWLIH